MPAFSLDVRSASGVVSQVPLEGQSLVLGRSREAQIFLDSRTISRRHAQFTLDPFGRWWIRDLGSHNGTQVNGQRVTEHMLKPGDLVQLGEFSLTIMTPDTSVPLAEGVSPRIPIVEADGGRVTTLRESTAPRLAATHLSILSEFGQQLLAIESPAARLDALCALMIRKEFHGRSAIVLRASKESFTEAPRPLCNPFSAPGEQNLSPYISRTLLRTLLARNEPVLASNSGPAANNAPVANMAELSLASDVMAISAVACPIRSEAAYTDLLYVLFPPEYGNLEWLALTSLAVKQFQQAEGTWMARKLGEDHAAIERELSRAHAIQKRLVPRDVSIPGLDFAIGFVPCRWVGGDYVDIVRGTDGRVLLAIADVCGKGLPAALVASSLHMLTHTAMRTNAPLPLIMQNLNVYLAETLADGTFVTMIAAMLDPNAGTLEIINAGHPAGFFITAKGEISLTQQSANLPLGLDATTELIGDATTLPQGSYLMLYTDGLSELHIANGELLGEDALAEHIAGIVKTQASPPMAGDLSANLTALLDSLQEGMSSDDRTFLIARRL